MHISRGYFVARASNSRVQGGLCCLSHILTSPTTPQSMDVTGLTLVLMHTNTGGGNREEKILIHKKWLPCTGADWEWLSAGQDLGYSRRRGGTTVVGMKWEQKNTGLPLLSAKFCKFLSCAPGGPEARWALAQSKRKAKDGHLSGVYCAGERVLLESLTRRLRAQRWILMAFPSVLLQLGWMSARQALLEHSP